MMGYESRLYIVEPTTLRNDLGYAFAPLITYFDMSKIGEMTDLFKPASDLYYFYISGAEAPVQDPYGQPYTEASIIDVINHLREEVLDSNHRRYIPLLAYLESLTVFDGEGREVLGKDYKNWKLLHSGY